MTQESTQCGCWFVSFLPNIMFFLDALIYKIMAISEQLLVGLFGNFVCQVLAVFEQLSPVVLSWQGEVVATGRGRQVLIAHLCNGVSFRVLVRGN